MEKVLEIITRLQAKIGLVLDQNRKVHEKLFDAQIQKQQLQAEINDLTHKINELQGRVNVLEMSNGFVTISGGTKSAKDRVNKLLREMDKCIALMNK